jgi:hypothetical protein
MKNFYSLSHLLPGEQLFDKILYSLFRLLSSLDAFSYASLFRPNSPPERKVPIILPPVIGRSKYEGRSASWYIVTVVGVWLHR